MNENNNGNSNGNHNDNHNENAVFLNFIYENSAMGVTTISQLLDIAKEETFRRHLEKELSEYKAIHEEARRLLNDNGFNEKGLTMFEKARTYLMISVQTMADQSASHIAEMMITGSNMGILDAVKHLKKAGDVERDIRSLMERLLKFEENNVQRLKEFL